MRFMSPGSLYPALNENAGYQGRTLFQPPKPLQKHQPSILYINRNPADNVRILSILMNYQLSRGIWDQFTVSKAHGERNNQEQQTGVGPPRVTELQKNDAASNGTTKYQP